MQYRSWRTNTGAVLGALGGAILTAAQLMGSYPKYKLIAEVAGTIMATFGGSLAAYGIGHKIERTTKPCEELPDGLSEREKPALGIGEAGATRLNVILAILVILAAGFLACVGTTPAEKSVCITEAAAQGSVICKIATEHGWTVEDIDSMLLDATITAWAFDAVEKEQIINALDQVEKYVLVNDRIILNQVTGLIIDDAKKSAALAAVVSRRIKFLDVPEVAQPYDIHLILTAVAHQREQFEGLK